MSKLRSFLVTLSPRFLTLELTPACNNKCAGCSNIFATDRSPAPLSFSEWRGLLAALMPDMVQVRLSGGEPTLHPEFFALLDFCTSYEAAVTVFTNGRWPRPAQFITQLKQHAHPNLTGLLISLHGADAQSHEAFTGVPGSFEETCVNIQQATAHGITVTLSTILTHQSWQQSEQVVALAHKLGAQSIAFNRYLGAPLPGIEPTLEEMRAAQVAIDRLIAKGSPVRYGIGIPQCFAQNSSGGCLAGVAYATVDPWGNLRPCNHSPTIVGSLFEHSMYDLWHSDTMNAWRDLMPDACTTCAAYATCHGGCRAIQELRADGRDPLRGKALKTYNPHQDIKEIPAGVCPTPNFRMQEEPFGYVLLSPGQVIPVAKEATTLFEACDGETTFAQLAEQFGQPGLQLLGELWEKGMLKAA